VSWGQLEQIGALWSFGDLPLRLELAPPGLGQHTREILQQLGFTAAERARLAEAAVIAGPDLA
jgi:crotonobetainyl-CoA:carnitine CoA-transferase CaiB-like acyl-CoA transferase